jgi:uncharacterized repeat protein (TIGR03803 family)
LAGAGTIFKFNPNDPSPLTNFKIIHYFVGGANDGISPYGDLLLIGTDLYGTTERGGGSGDFGTVFKLPTTASPSDPIVLVHKFAGGPADGSSPRGGLVFDGSHLYGTTTAGGAIGIGTVFKVSTDGTSFSLVHSFDGSGGATPLGSLVWVSGSPGWLYGTTMLGGVSNQGTVFKVTTDGVTFDPIHSFAGSPSDGAVPETGLVFDGAYLYGTTYYGGSQNYGTVFRVKKDDDTNFNWLLHDFSPSTPLVPPDGSYPAAKLLIAGSVLYGTSFNGNSGGGYGTVFSMNADSTGSSFQTLGTFAGGSAGWAPWAGLYSDGSNLWGTTFAGGTWGAGTIFSIPTGGGTPDIKHSFAGRELPDPFGVVMDDGGNLYGTTPTGGDSNLGTVFKIRAADRTVRILHSFAGTASSDGDTPVGELILVPGSPCGTLYGATQKGGAYGVGTVFSISTDDAGTAFTVLHDFGNPSYSDDGVWPIGPLTPNGAGVLYGTTIYGGTNGLGMVFSLVTGASRDAAVTNVHSFDATGSFPSGPVTVDGAGYLYGATGGDNSTEGTSIVYRIKIADGSLLRLFAFKDLYTPAGGALYDFPVGRLVSSSGYVYGVTESGGTWSNGYVFKAKTDGTEFKMIHDFTGDSDDGGSPYAGPILSDDGNLYGTALYGGFYGIGLVFSLPVSATKTTPLTLVHSFAGSPDDGGNPMSPLWLDASGNLYGTTSYGGAYGAGAEFMIAGSFGTGSGGTTTADGNCGGGCTPPGAPTASPVILCGPGTVTLTASGADPKLQQDYKWYTASTGGSPVQTKGASYGTPWLLESTPYYVSIYDTTTLCESGRTKVIANVNAIPPAPGASPVFLCGPGTATLVASGAGTGQDYKWYSASTGGSPIGTGILLPISISPTTTYYVSIYDTTTLCESGRIPVTATVRSLPSPPSVTNGSHCGPGKVTLTASGAHQGGPGPENSENYIWWSVPTGGKQPLQSGLLGSYITPSLWAPITTYYAAIINGYGCESPRTPVTATINPVPSPSINVRPSANPFLEEPASILSPNAGSTYLWGILNGTIVGPATGPSITFTPGASGVTFLSVVETTINGCVSPTVTANVTITKGTFAFVSGDASICQSSSPMIQGPSATIEVLMTGTPPWSLEWSDGFKQTARTSPATRTVRPRATEVFTLSRFADSRSLGSFSGSAKITVNALPARPLMKAPSSATRGQSFNASVSVVAGVTRYLWMVSNGDVTVGQGTPSITVTAGSHGSRLTISVAVWNAAGCQTASLRIVTLR